MRLVADPDGGLAEGDRFVTYVDPGQMLQLTHASRQAKEQLLADPNLTSAPVTVTWVPSGSDGATHPSDSLLPPVPEQCAAWPMYTVLPSV